MRFFSKFPNFNFKGHLHNLQKSFTDKCFCLLPLLTVFFGVSRSLILDTSHSLNLRHLFTVYGDAEVTKLLNHFHPYLSAVCEDVEDFAGEALMEWDDLKSQIYAQGV
jgi:hypothetical protein